jgi:hypothetical protein
MSKMVDKRHTASPKFEDTCAVAFIHHDDHYIQLQSQVKPSHTMYIVYTDIMYSDIRFLIA